ncbi:MAG: nicotinate-nucleotide adenylyltransferase [Pseudomonadota bacterium]
MKIGLFGGTFNPFHNGHIDISLHVQQAHELEKIFFIPSATPPHKPDTNLACAQDRYEMVKASLKGHKTLLVSDKELNREGPSYTIDTINAFKQEYDPGTQFYLLMGSDAFLDITTWKAKDQLFKIVKIIIMLRGDWGNTRAIASFIDENISKGYTFNKKNEIFSHAEKQEIIICKVPKIDISSTMIREQIKQNKAISDLVPASVERIIRTKELYQ